MVDRIKMPSRLDARRDAMILSIIAQIGSDFLNDRPNLNPRDTADIAERAATLMFDRLYKEDAELKFLQTLLEKMMEQHLAGLRLMTNLAHPAVMIRHTDKGLEVEPIKAEDFYAKPEDPPG